MSQYIAGMFKPKHPVLENNLEWSKELPTQDGHYWCKWGVSIEMIKIQNGCVLDFGDETAEPVEEYLNCEWYGPIEPPEDNS